MHVIVETSGLRRCGRREGFDSRACSALRQSSWAGLATTLAEVFLAVVPLRVILIAAQFNFRWKVTFGNPIN